MDQKPSIGRIVHYQLTQENADAINRRRTNGPSISARLPLKEWPEGAQAHIGNPASAEQIQPMIITAVWPDEGGSGIPGVNGQVMLDGSDSLWVTSAHEGTAPGTWSWPPRV